MPTSGGSATDMDVTSALLQLMPINVIQVGVRQQRPQRELTMLPDGRRFRSSDGSV